MNPNMNMNPNPNMNMNMNPNPNTIQTKKDYIRFGFNYRRGCGNLEKIDTLTDIPPELRAESKRIIKEEINDKVHRVRINPWCFCWLLVFMLLMIIGGVGVIFMFPYNFILTGIGFACFVSFLVFMFIKSCKQTTFIHEAAMQMSRQTGGKMVIEPIMKIYLVYRKRRTRRRSRCVGILLRHRDSKMNLKRLKNKKNPLVIQNQNMVQMQQQQIMILQNQNQILARQNEPQHPGNFGPNMPLPHAGYQQPNTMGFQQHPQQNYAMPANQNPGGFNNMNPNNPYANNMGQNNMIPMENFPEQGGQQEGLYDPFGGQGTAQPLNLHNVQAKGAKIENYDGSKK